ADPTRERSAAARTAGEALPDDAMLFLHGAIAVVIPLARARSRWEGARARAHDGTRLESELAREDRGIRVVAVLVDANRVRGRPVHRAARSPTVTVTVDQILFAPRARIALRFVGSAGDAGTQR